MSCGCREVFELLAAPPASSTLAAAAMRGPLVRAVCYNILALVNLAVSQLRDVLILNEDSETARVLREAMAHLQEAARVLSALWSTVPVTPGPPLNPEEIRPPVARPPGRRIVPRPPRQGPYGP